MKNYLCLSLFILSGLVLQGQTTYRKCGTAPNKQWDTQMQGRIATLQAANAQKSAPIRIPYQIHLIKASDGTSQLTLPDIYKAIDTTNKYLIPANIILYECWPPEIILDDSLYLYYIQKEPILTTHHYTPNVLNMYFPDDSKSFSGYAYLPPSLDLAVVTYYGLKGKGTMAHELGHYLGLEHTFDVFYGAELVDGSNCATAGDKFCDTPADPGITYLTVDSMCVYTDTVRDANGMLYTPDVTNFMSYSAEECVNSFSPMQRNFMRNVALTDRANLVCSSGVGMQEYGRSLFSVFPNPGSESLSVSLEQEGDESTFELYDVYGKRILSAAGSGTYHVDTKALPVGIYCYKLGVSGNTYTGKWIKE